MGWKKSLMFLSWNGKKYWQDKNCGNLSTQTEWTKGLQKKRAKSMVKHNRKARANFFLWNAPAPNENDRISKRINHGKHSTKSH